MADRTFACMLQHSINEYMFIPLGNVKTRPERQQSISDLYHNTTAQMITQQRECLTRHHQDRTKQNGSKIKMMKHYQMTKNANACLDAQMAIKPMRCL